MIPAQKSRWFNAWFARHARARIRATFGRVLVAGLDGARSAARETPIVAVMNHTTWWDALVALWLSELVLGVDGYAMMNAENLRRLPFFTRVGGFGVDLDDPSDGARGIRYAVRRLDAPGKVVWVFPEGRERSPFEPLVLQPGAAQVARVARRARVLPVGLRYVFGEGERPDLFVSFGPAEAAARTAEDGLARQTRALGAELARIDAVLATRKAVGFELVHARRASPLGALAERLLAALLPLGRDARR